MGLQFGSNGIDPDSYEANRVEAQVVGMSGPLTSALTYAFIRSQPEYGITSDRSRSKRPPRCVCRKTGACSWIGPLRPHQQRLRARCRRSGL